MSSDNIKVCIRIRPLNSREATSGQLWMWGDNHLTLCSEPEKPIASPSATYSFDHVFGTEVKTTAVYDQTSKELVKSAMDGINGTIFAYGQTSSGKTYTMQGTAEDPGIIPQTVGDIFTIIQNTPEREFLLRVSYLEIYNEVISDLLSNRKSNLKIHEDIQRGIFVGDLKEEIVTSVDHAISLMEEGEGRRHVGCTDMNERSSRSHTIYRMIIESRPRSAANENSGENDDEDGAVLCSTVTLVDLAGSERVAHTGAQGARLKEGGHINKSLLALTTVINKLSESQTGHIPYRDSKLTRILQPSLGGNVRTAIICAVTPASMHTEETVSTLKFASRAKKIENKAHINEVLDDQAMLKRYKKEIAGLKKKLNSMGKDDKEGSNESVEELKAQMEKNRLEHQSKLEKLATMMITSKSIAAQSRREKDRGRKRLPMNRRETWAPGLLQNSGLSLGPIGGGVRFTNADLEEQLEADSNESHNSSITMGRGSSNGTDAEASRSSDQVQCGRHPRFASNEIVHEFEAPTPEKPAPDWFLAGSNSAPARDETVVAELNDLRQQMENVLRENEILQHDFEELREEKQARDDACATHLDDLSNVQSQLNDEIKRHDSVQQNLTQTQAARDSARQSCSESESKHTALQQQFDQLVKTHQAVEAAHQEAVTSLDVAAKEHSQALSENIQKMDQMKQSLAASEKQQNVFEQLATERKERLTILDETIAQKTKQLNEAAEYLVKMDAKMNEAEQAVKQSNEKTTSLEAQLQTSEEQRHALEKQLAEEHIRVEECQAKIGELQTTGDSCDVGCQADPLESSDAATQYEEDAVESDEKQRRLQHEEMAVEIAVLQSEMSTARGTIQRLETENQELKQKTGGVEPQSRLRMPKWHGGKKAPVAASAAPSIADGVPQTTNAALCEAQQQAADAQCLCREIQTENEQLHARLAEQTGQLATQKKELTSKEEFKKQLQQSRDAVEKAHSDAEKLKKDLQEARREVAGARKMAQDSKREKERIENSTSGLEKEKNKAVDQVSSLKSELQSTKDLYKEAKREIQAATRLKKEMETQNREREKLASKLKDTECRLRNAAQEKASVAAEMATKEMEFKRLTGQNNTLVKQLEKSEAIHKTVDDRAKDLAAQLSTAERRSQEFQRQNERAKIDVEEATRANENAQQQLSDALANEEEMHAQLTQAQTQLSALSEEHTALEECVAAAESLANERAKSMEALSTERDFLDKQLQQTMSEVESMGDRIAEFEQQTQADAELRAKQQSGMDQLQTALTDAQFELEEKQGLLQSTEARLNKELEAANAAKQAVEVRLRETTTQAAEQQQQLEGKVKELNAKMIDSATVAEEERSELTRTIATMRTEALEAMQKIDALEEAKLVAEGLHKELEDELKRVQSAADQGVFEHQTQLEESHLQAQQLSELVKVASENLEETAEKLKGSIEKQQEGESRLLEAEEKLTWSEAQADQMKDELTSARDEIAALKAQKQDDYKEELQTMQKDLEKATKKAAKMREEKGAIKFELQKLKRKSAETERLLASSSACLKLMEDEKAQGHPSEDNRTEEIKQLRSQLASTQAALKQAQEKGHSAAANDEREEELLEDLQKARSEVAKLRKMFRALETRLQEEGKGEEFKASYDAVKMDMEVKYAQRRRLQQNKHVSQLLAKIEVLEAHIKHQQMTEPRSTNTVKEQQEN